MNDVDAGDPVPESPRDKGGKRGRVLDVVDGMDMVLYGVAGLAVLGWVIYAGVRAAHRLGGLGAAVGVLALLSAGLVVLIRDIAQRRWSPLSVGAVAAYVACVLLVVARDAV